VDILKARLGQRVKALRRKQRLTQAQVAARSEMSPKYVGEIERGDANPSLEFMIRIAQTLAVNVWDLLMPDGKIEARGSELSGLALTAVRDDVQHAYDSLHRAVGYLGSVKDTPAKPKGAKGRKAAPAKKRRR